MSVNLLEKEQQYRKANEELQNHNKKLMEEFDIVMKTQDTYLRESLQSDTRCDYSNVTHRKSEGDSLLNKSKDDSSLLTKQFDSSFVKENCKNLQNIIPDTVDHMGVKGMSQFYRGRIKQMLSEKDKLQIEIKKKDEELKAVEKENLKLIEEKEKWFQAFTTNKIGSAKLDNQINALNMKCQTKETENTSMRKEIEQYKKELKCSSANISTAEVRLSRAMEENEKLKTSLAIAKHEEKALKEVHRKELTEMKNVVKRLEKQKAELLWAFKKQMQLIDTIKKQKAFIEAVKLTEISENEFMRVLDIKVDT